MRPPSLRVFDADNHLYETPDALTKYLPQKFKGAIQWVEIRGRTRLALRGKITEFMPNPTFEKVAAPGAHAAFYSGRNPKGLTLREMGGKPIDCEPAFREPAARLKRLDEQGVHRALVYPTLANLVEHEAGSDPDLTVAIVHALNQWMHEVWSFGYEGRIFPAPVVSLPLVENAITELEWLLERGARAIVIRPAPVIGYRGSRSIALPEFDPFWARVEEAGTLVCFHANFPPLTEYVETWEPQTTDSAFVWSPFKAWALGHREIEDTIAAMICHGALTRFPKLKIASVENGSDWVPHLLDGLGKVFNRMPQMFAEHPVEVFRRNVWVHPFWETNLAELVDLIGDDHVLFGSDYPHPEGMAVPLSYFDELEGFGEASIRKIMSENAHGLLGLEAD
jgi:predicted TIM-barrel fold metal-dependent hydrolase